MTKTDAGNHTLHLPSGKYEALTIEDEGRKTTHLRVRRTPLMSNGGSFLRLPVELVVISETFG